MEKRYVEAIYDSEGFLIAGDYTAWDCDCGNEIRRYRGVGERS